MPADRSMRWQMILSRVVGEFFAFIAKYGLPVLHKIYGNKESWRSLTDSEIAELRKVFHSTVPYEKITVLDTKYPGPFGKRPNAVKYRIWMKDFMQRHEEYRDSHYYHNYYTAQMVHEVCHVWQYEQIGVRYIADALRAQWFTKSGYDWRAEIRSGCTDWLRFNAEAQCESIMDIYRKAAELAVKPEFDFERVDFTDEAQLKLLVSEMNGIDDTDKVVGIARGAFQRLRASS